MGATALNSIDITGATIVNTSAVTTTGGQTYTGATTLRCSSTFTGGNIRFSTINGASGQNLTIDTTGTSSVSGAIGSTMGPFQLIPLAV